jgi:hypothetical protein
MYYTLEILDAELRRGEIYITSARKQIAEQQDNLRREIDDLAKLLAKQDEIEALLLRLRTPESL